MKKIIFLFMCISIFIIVSCKTKSTNPSLNGNKTEQGEENININPPHNATIIIENSEELITLSQRAENGETFENEYIWLKNDIDLTGKIFNGIKVKNNANGNNVFEGVFDGNGKKIININIEKTGENNIGFIAETSSKAVIKDLTISGNVKANNNVGLLVGINKGFITNVANDGGGVNGGFHLGGIAGINAGKIKSSYNMAKVEGNNWVGGIVGFNYSVEAMIENCYNVGELKSSLNAGGIVGANGGSAGNEVGGLIKNCYNVALITAYNKGSIVVHTRGGQYENNYALNGIGGTLGSVIQKNVDEFSVSSFNLDASIWKDKTGLSGNVTSRPVLINVGNEGK